MAVLQPEIEPVLALVRESLTQHLCEHSGATVENVEILKVFQRPYSTTTVLAALTDCGTRRFVLKQIAKHPLNASILDGPDRSAVEYDILTQLYPGFTGVERCSVPLPIVVLTEIDAYIMEFVEGDILADRLNFVHYLASRTKFGQLQDHFHDCGRWLRHFQEFTGRRLAAVSAVDNVVVRAHDRLRLIEESGNRHCPKDFRKKATDFIEKQVRKLANTEILVTGRHGDFGPWNTLAGPGGVTVIDFFGSCEDPLPVDVLSMLVYLESISHGIANSPARCRTLQKKFLAGFGPVPKLPESLVLLCEAQQRIQQIAARIISSEKGVFGRWERFRSLRANVEWFLAPPDESSLWPK